MLSSPSRIQIFKLIGSVLDQSVSSWMLNTGLPLENFVCDVEKAIRHMGREYFSRKRPEIRFDGLPYRTAYLYQYASANAFAVETLLNDDSNHQRLISGLLRSKQRISMCCLGGGPGSEIIGMAKWIMQQQAATTELEVCVTDIFPQWKYQWEFVRDTLNTTFLTGGTVSEKRLPLVTSRGVATVDVINPASARLPVLRRAFDLFVVSYVVSHIYTSEGLSQFGAFIRSVIDSAPKGSKFLFIDRNEREWDKSVTTLLDHPGIEISGTYFSSSDSPGDPREEKSDLGVLYEHLNVFPRLSWNIFWVVGTKV